MNRIRNLADGEREYLQGVIEFYRARAGAAAGVGQAPRLVVTAACRGPSCGVYMAEVHMAVRI
jgi:magnesium transporter